MELHTKPTLLGGIPVAMPDGTYASAEQNECVEECKDKDDEEDYLMSLIVDD